MSLASTNPKPEDELRRFAPQLIFWFYILIKPCIAIELKVIAEGIETTQ
ncbi:hypothetical protein [Phormidium tenue]|jgi:hypothetical protein|uniref:Uncharacterized protein n=1 Tax=Phormidium tenue FACHB-1050 TaxID=2692857 RepID=A0ABR8CCN3_9CYAN|nr:hypothetical protein [Phormidium tenue]MBD2318518.1 hypothetical protein [Phormidium tenue FACHB-1050]